MKIHFNTPLLYSSNSVFLLPSICLGWNTFGHKFPIWPSGHVAMLNQRPGHGHTAAESTDARLEAKLPAGQPSSDNNVLYIKYKPYIYIRLFYSGSMLAI